MERESQWNISQIRNVSNSRGAMCLEPAATGPILVGLTSFISPCVLPFVSLLSRCYRGVSIGQPTAAEKSSVRPRAILVAGTKDSVGVVIFSGQMSAIAGWSIEIVPTLGRID